MVYVAFTVVSCIVNIAHMIWTKDGHHILKICSLLPFLVCFLVYLFSVFRINGFLRKMRVFVANQYLTRYPYIVLTAYFVHLLRWPVESWWLDIETGTSQRDLTIKFGFFCVRQTILMLVAYTMYRFTDTENIVNFDKAMSVSTLTVNDSNGTPEKPLYNTSEDINRTQSENAIRRETEHQDDVRMNAAFAGGHSHRAATNNNSATTVQVFMTLVSTRERITQYDVFNDLRRLRLSLDNPEEVVTGKSEVVPMVVESEGNDGNQKSAPHTSVGLKTADGFNKISLNQEEYE